MPTYEYLRSDGTRFEFIQKMSDSPLKECPVTGLPVKRVISGGAGVVYKGEGWYVTDYKNVGPSQKAEPANETTKTESKPGATSDAG